MSTAVHLLVFDGFADWESNPPRLQLFFDNSSS